MADVTFELESVVAETEQKISELASAFEQAEANLDGAFAHSSSASLALANAREEEALLVEKEMMRVHRSLLLEQEEQARRNGKLQAKLGHADIERAELKASKGRGEGEGQGGRKVRMRKPARKKEEKVLRSLTEAYEDGERKKENSSLRNELVELRAKVASLEGQVTRERAGRQSAEAQVTALNGEFKILANQVVTERSRSAQIVERAETAGRGGASSGVPARNSGGKQDAKGDQEEKENECPRKVGGGDGKYSKIRRLKERIDKEKTARRQAERLLREEMQTKHSLFSLLSEINSLQQREGGSLPPLLPS